MTGAAAEVCSWAGVSAERAQWPEASSPAQDLAPIGFVEMPAHGSNERKQEPDDGAKPANALLQLEHLGLEPNVVHVEHVAAHYGPVVTLEWSQPAAVERGTSNAAAMFMSPVVQTRSRSRWSYARCGRFCDEAIADHRLHLKDDAHHAAGDGPGGQRAAVCPGSSRTRRHFSDLAVEKSRLWPRGCPRMLPLDSRLVHRTISIHEACGKRS